MQALGKPAARLYRMGPARLRKRRSVVPHGSCAIAKPSGGPDHAGRKPKIAQLAGLQRCGRPTTLVSQPEPGDSERERELEPTRRFELRTCCLRSRSAQALRHKRGIASVGRSQLTGLRFERVDVLRSSLRGIRNGRRRRNRGHRRHRHAALVGQGCQVPAHLAYLGTSASPVERSPGRNSTGRTDAAIHSWSWDQPSSPELIGSRSAGRHLRARRAASISSRCSPRCSPRTA